MEYLSLFQKNWWILEYVPKGGVEQLKKDEVGWPWVLYLSWILTNAIVVGGRGCGFQLAVSILLKIKFIIGKYFDRA